MNHNAYLREFIKINNQSKERIESNFYGNDMLLLKKINLNCYKSEIQFTNCLKSLGFKKAEEYSIALFSRINLWSKFVKQYPEFYKLKRDLQIKLLLNYFKDNSFPNFPV